MNTDLMSSTPGTGLPNPEMARPARRVSRDLFLEQIERVRMDAAQAAAEVVGMQQRLLGIIEATAVMWRELTGEEAPEIEIAARIVRSA